MNLKSLSNTHLREKLVSISKEERKLTLELLHRLREFDHRKLYAERGHSSLFEYVTRELKYSESAAQRRIFAMRALRDLPELEAKVESGELKVTQLAQVQSFIRMEQKTGRSFSLTEKKELIESTIGKSTRETEKMPTEKNPDAVIAHRESVRSITPEYTQLTFVADEALMHDLQTIRDRFAHRLPVGASVAEVIRFLAKTVLTTAPKRKDASVSVQKQKNALTATKTTISSKALNSFKVPDPSKVPETTNPSHSPEITTPRESTPPSLPAPVKPCDTFRTPTRYVPLAVKRQVWRRDRGECTWISKETGRRCAPPHRLQLDHIRPWARGGETSARNLRLLCASHNALEARRWFRFIPRQHMSQRRR